MWCCCLVLVDTPLSAFLLFLQLPSCTCHQLSTQRTERTLSNPGWGTRIRARKGARWRSIGSVTSPDCGWWGLKEWWGSVRGRSNISIIFHLSNGKHLCGVSIPAGDIIVWRCVMVMYCWNVLKPFNVFQIQSDLNSLISESINHGCASASRQLWQSHSLVNS